MVKKMVDAMSTPEERRSRSKKFNWSLAIGALGVGLSLIGTGISWAKKSAALEIAIEGLPRIEQRVGALEGFIPAATIDRAILRQRTDEQDRRIAELEETVRQIHKIPGILERMEKWLDKH